MPPKKAKAKAGEVTDEIANLKAQLLNKLSDKGADLDDYKKKILDVDADDNKQSDEPPQKKPKKAAQRDTSPPLDPNIQAPVLTPVTTSSFHARWQVLLGGNWVDFPLDQGKAIEEAYLAKNANVTLPPHRGQTYCITFGDMMQTNVSTKKQRNVRRLEPAGRPQSPNQVGTPTSSNADADEEPLSPKIGERRGERVVAQADEEPPPLETATFTLVPVETDSEEFWDLEEKFGSALQGRNEDYVAKRLEKKLKPISFVLKAAEKIVNPVLEKRFAIRKAKLAQVTQDKGHLRERVSFHGTHPRNIPNMCKYSLLRFKHPMNPCKSQVDDGFFGSNRKGIYVSRYADYTFKYANRQIPLEPGEKCKIIQFRTLPGRSKHIPKMCGPIDPTEGYDSHSSPSFLEWYLFNEDQLLPEYVLTVEAKEDTRTASDDM